METLITALMLVAIVTLIGDMLSSFGSRLLTRPGVTPPLWVEPLIERWSRAWGVDDVS